MRHNESFVVEMKRIFDEADADCSGKISWAEFKSYMQNPRTRAYFATKQLDAFDARSFFDMIRDGMSEEVDIETFILGCQRMKGMAKSVDLLAVLRETRETKRAMKALLRKLEGKPEAPPSCVMSRASTCQNFRKTSLP